MSKIDFEGIAAAALSSAEGILFTMFPLGQTRGREFIVGGIDGSRGESLSVNMQNGLWSDFATGDTGGDLISLLAAKNGMSQKDAAEEMQDLLGLPQVKDAPKNKAPAKKKKSTGSPFIPDLNPPSIPGSFKHRDFGQPSSSWEYRAADGHTMFYVHRYDKENGDKEITPQVYGEMDGKKQWRFKHVPDNRPMYGLNKLHDRQRKGKAFKVLIVEGEKAADAAQILCPQLVTMTWSGGSSAANKTDFSPMKGQKIAIWPDADSKKDKDGKVLPKEKQPGRKAALDVKRLCEEAGAESCVVMDFAYSDYPDGWDAADALIDGWDSTKTKNFLRKGVIAGKEAEQDPVPDIPESPPQEFVAKSEDDKIVPFPFVCLGYNHDVYYYYAERKKQIRELTPREHNSSNLLELADIEYWQAAYKAKNSAKIEYDKAVSRMFSDSIKVGIFKPETVRGRGAWLDAGKVVFHMGDCLYIDGEERDIYKYRGNYVYELDKREINFVVDEPLDVDEAYTLLRICEGCRWKSKIFGRLLAGWCVTAPICGALEWRSHIWITGPAGSGKTWVLNNIVKPAASKFACDAGGGTTEAALRQTLVKDARPILFDESEAQNRKEREQMAAILALMRQSSSEGGAKIIKGGSGGKATEYNIRSSFCLSSIGVNIEQYADETRISILSLDLPENTTEEEKIQSQRQFTEIEEMANELTEGFVQGLFLRSISMVHTIRKNCKTFGRVIARKVGSQRHGDQLGTLLAGAYSLESDDEISEEDAAAYIESLNATSVIQSVGEPDDVRCYNHLIDQQLKITIKTGTYGNRSQVDRGVGEIVDFLQGEQDIEGLDTEEAKRALKSHGLVIDENQSGFYLMVANDSDWLKKAFSETAWANWTNVLKQLPNADTNDNKPIRLSGNRVCKCVRIKLGPGRSLDLH